MLATLFIENFAIIERVTIDFSRDMTVLSGETGAGKSIIIDALGILCGGRGSAEWVRQGADKLILEGQFSFGETREDIQVVLAEVGIEYDSLAEDLILRREITASGKNTIRINGQLVNVTTLKKVGVYLIDIHGQNEHQQLLDNGSHLALLDQFSGQTLVDVLTQYQSAYKEYRALRKEWLQAQTEEKDQHQREQFLQFQVQEIESVQLVDGEEEELLALSQKLQHSHQARTALEQINGFFSEMEGNVLDNLSQVMTLTESISSYHEVYPALLERIESAYYELQEVSHELAMSEEVFDIDESVDEIEYRLNELDQLKRKYHLTIPEIQQYYADISEELYQIQHRERYLERLSKEVLEAYHKAFALAEQVHQIRVTAATMLVEVIHQELADLYMEKSRFAVQFEEEVVIDDTMTQTLNESIVQLTKYGYDSVEFYAATNVGELMKPLVKVASGGELSRFMLALKTVFSRSVLPKTMVFDEIDTGVSGRVAQAIAEKMHSIHHRHQVLCITHLPQVAAIAEEQLYVSKKVVDERTMTEAVVLSEDERVEVIAQMMSGKVLTPNSIALAQEMLATMRQGHE